MRRAALFLALLAPSLSWPAHAQEAEADDAMPPPGYVPGHRDDAGLGLSPHVPGEQSVLPGGVTPSFGAPLRPNEGAKFDFHGHLQIGTRAGIGSRKSAGDEQSSSTLHGDPVVPRGNVFENVGVVPYVWSALEFSYSTPAVTGTVVLGAWSFSESMQSSGAFNPGAQLWFNDAFLTYTPARLDPVKLTWRVGAFEDRYGYMDRYGAGHYGTPLIATLSGVGETLTVEVPLASALSLTLEHGIKSNLARPPADAPTGATNNWAKPWEGQTFAHHAHAALDVAGTVQAAVHWVSAFARDDQGDQVPLGSLRAGYDDYTGGAPALDPELDHADGSLQTIGADLRFDLRDFGYLYLGAAQTSVEHVRTLGGVVQILGAGGGRDLMDRYFGRNNDFGRGKLLLAGGEYSISLGTVLRRPEEFWGEGPDLRLSVFGMFGAIESDDPARDGEKKYKFGLEALYTPLSWLALAGRFDRAVPYVEAPSTPLYPRQNDNSYSVATARAVLRSDWQAREALTLQYSRFFYRSNFHLVTLNSGGQVSNVSDEPDQHLLALYGTLWW